MQTQENTVEISLPHGIKLMDNTARVKIKKAIVHLDKGVEIMRGFDFINCLFKLHGFDSNGCIQNDVANHSENCTFIDCCFEYAD